MVSRKRIAPRVPADATSTLRVARTLMAEALAILDRHPATPAAATLDLAIHHLDRAIEAD